jgi:hypothetical protein
VGWVTRQALYCVRACLLVCVCVSLRKSVLPAFVSKAQRIDNVYEQCERAGDTLFTKTKS